MFSDAGPDVRWIGNEARSSPAHLTGRRWTLKAWPFPPYPEPRATPSAPERRSANGTVWRPGEDEDSTI